LEELGVGVGKIDLLAKVGGEAKELFRGNFVQFAGGEFLLDGVMEFGEAAEIVLVGREDFFVQGFAFEGAEGVNLIRQLAVPIEEGGFGDADLSGDAGEAPALGAEFDKLASGFVGVHGGS